MRLVLASALVGLLVPLPTEAADLLAEARRLYNAGQYEAAERVARDARVEPGLADGARLVLGRIHLERFRRSANPEDLASARDALREVDPRSFSERERLELTIGLGEALYLNDQFGAAAEVFESTLDRAAPLVGPAARERLLDWWATALDRQAQTRPREAREPVYRRVLDRMQHELAEDPGSTPAVYWLIAAARGVGDLERAWYLTMAGWVRAQLARDRGAALRADLDRLMMQAIIPERVARLQLRDSKQALAGMTAEWEAFKASWSR
jgi:hypothetical protein